MPCLLCKNEKLSKTYEPLNAGGKILRRCSSCSLLQIDPLPTDGELNEFYQRYDVLGEREPYYEKMWGPDALKSPEGRDLAARFEWMKGKLNPLGRVLDVGSGTGLFLRLAKDSGFEASGVELNAKAAEKSAKELGVRVHQGTINTVNDGPYDAVTLWDIIEHVNDPIGLIKKCHALLVDNGWLYIETPDESSLLDRAVLACARLGWHAPANTFYGLHHLILFRRPAISRLLEENGFKIVEIRGAATTVGRVFRGNGFKDRMMRAGLGVLFLIARLVGRQNKMLIAARKRL